MPVALAFTAGILLDRLAAIDLPLVLVLAAAPALFWLRRRRDGVFFLWSAIFFLGAAYHAWRVREQPADWLGRMRELEEKPVRVQGRVASEPQPRPAAGTWTLLSAMWIVDVALVYVPTPCSTSTVTTAALNQ